MAVATERLEHTLPQAPELTRQFVKSVYERFDASLRGFLMKRLRHPEDAEDMAQEVYLRFAGLKDHGSIRSERAFLFSTATNLLRDRSRRLSTRLERASICCDDVVLDCSSDDPALRVCDAETLAAVRESLDELSDNCRRAFLRSRVEGDSYAEIAAELGVSVSMVEKHISAALIKLSADV